MFLAYLLTNFVFVHILLTASKNSNWFTSYSLKDVNWLMIRLGSQLGWYPMKKKFISMRKKKKRQILSWNSFPPHLWNIKCPIVERIIWPLVGHILNRRCGGEGQNNDVSHDRAPLIRLIAQLWNSCSTIGLQDLANHQSWNHVNSLIAELRKTQHFCKYFLPGGAMHTKSI